MRRLYQIEFKESDETKKVIESFIASQHDKGLPKELRYTLQGIDNGIYLFVPGDLPYGSKQFTFEEES